MYLLITCRGASGFRYGSDVSITGAGGIGLAESAADDFTISLAALISRRSSFLREFFALVIS